MSNPNTFISNYVTATQTLVAVLQQLRTYNDMLVADSTLTTRYFAQSPPPRADIVAADITAAKDALVQLLFTFDSGAPTQKAALYKLLP